LKGASETDLSTGDLSCKYLTTKCRRMGTALNLKLFAMTAQKAKK